MKDRVGEQLGNYRLVRFLAEGGFAEVYLGEHIYLKTPAAIKVLHMRVAKEDVGDFLTEARTVANLVHPHIVRVLDFGLEGSNPFLVMEYAHNGTLRQKHKRGTRLSPQEILPYLKQIADALQYAHDEKLIHRDVKPENMLINKRNDILLSDFGTVLESKSSRFQSVQDVIGTVAYMAPEQIQGRPRRSSDQYALAIVLYEWLTGERPFRGTFTEIATQQVSVSPPPLSEKGVTLSPDIEQVLMTALSKDPQQRFGSVTAFARAFEQACQEPTAHTPSLSQTRYEFSPAVYDVNVSPPSELLAPTKYDVNVPPPAELLAPTEYVAYTPQSAEPLAPTELATPSSATSQPAIHTPPATAPITSGTGDRTPGKLLYVYRGHSAGVSTVAWSPDGTRIVSADRDREVQVWDATTGRKLLYFALHKAEVSTVAWSPDSTRIASAGKDLTVQVWEVKRNGDVMTYNGHSSWIRSVAWSPDGARIVSSCLDGQVHVWDATTGRKTLFFTLHKAEVSTVAWSPDGTRIASAGRDRLVQVWEAKVKGDVVTYGNHEGWIRSLAWSPDSKRIASAGKDRIVRIWEAATGHNLLLFNRHTDEVYTVAWSPDGKRIASAGKDRTVRVWEAVVSGEAARFKGASDSITAVTWSPDGTRIAAACADGTVQVWQCNL